MALTLFALSAVITLLVLLAARSPAPAAGVSSGAGEGTEAQAAPMRPLSVSDFILEEAPFEQTGPYLLRPPTPRWSDEQVERYWVPLEEVILDIVSARSDERIDEIFRDVE